MLFSAARRGAAPAPLAVVAVGSFEASFVPQLKDFARLDERFRLPEETWAELPQYKSFGFAVFKLKPGKKEIHPMAFEFPRANERQLFFPTVHIHDGKVHEEAKFDHWLFCQVRDDGHPKALMQWRESPALASTFMKSLKSEGIIDARNHCYMLQLKGKMKNQDTLV